MLLVEDEPNIANIIVFKLEREGHEVRWEEAAAGVLAAASQFQPDLVVLDSSLPDGDPFLLLASLRSAAPVLVLTEFRDRDSPRRAAASGAAATMEKPFKPTVLARLVAQLTTGAPAAL